MNFIRSIRKGTVAIILLFIVWYTRAQEMGVNFNESLFHAEDVAKLSRTKTTWVRGFFDFFSYYENQNRLSDANDQLDDFLNLKSAGFKTILNIKWNFHNKSYPDTTSTEIAAYNEFLQRFLNRVWEKIDIIVVGNEPFIESMNDEERNKRLAPFYQYMCTRVRDYRIGKNAVPIYFGAFNRLYSNFRDTEGVLKMLQFAKEKPWIEGIDLHIHHKENNEFVSMYSYANDRIRDNQKILITEFSLVFWWADNTRNLIPSDFAAKYGYNTDMLVHQYIYLALNNRRPKQEWDDFLRMCPWFESRKNYLMEVYELLSQYKSLNVATYSYEINWNTNLDGNTVPWLLNNLIAAVTVEDDPQTGWKQFNYSFIDDFKKIQELSLSQTETPKSPDRSKLFMEFGFDEKLADASSEKTVLKLSKGSESYVDGKFGKALKFNNTVYVTEKENLINVGSESSTLGAWVKMDQSTSVANAGMTILHQKDPAGATPPGRIMMEILNGDLPSSFESGIRAQSFDVIKPETWIHIAVVHNAEKGMKSIYVNGELKGIAGFGTEQSLGAFVMGAFKTEDRAFLYGGLDELFWTREVLSPEQIKMIMAEGISKSFGENATAVVPKMNSPEMRLFFPNPAKKSIEFSSEMLKMQGLYQLLDMNGRTVSAQQPVQAGKINLDKLTKGFYLMKIVAENKTYLNRLILTN